MAVTISGMFGNDKTYFTDSPVVIDISGLEWGTRVKSPFTVLRVNVIYNGSIVGTFNIDMIGQTSISLDISSALRAIWADYDFSTEVVKTFVGSTTMARPCRVYALEVFTEYIDSTNGEFTKTSSGIIHGGRCVKGRLTEWERSTIAAKEDADVSSLENSNLHNGDASTKPTDSLERVGKNSITSWVDITGEGTLSEFYTADITPSSDNNKAHAPIVIRDTQLYQDFIFVNRRGAMETCSALIKEVMEITVETKQYKRAERPTFKPSHSLMAISTGGRRSWQMSSGYLPREWIEWWTMEFLCAHQWWMLYNGKYVPVIVEPSKKNTTIYDRNKQQMQSVDFTVTLGLEG